MNDRNALCMWLALFAAVGTQAAGAETATDVRLSGERFVIAFSRENGSILGLWQQGKAEPIVRGGENGLWQACFAEGSRLDASRCSAASTERSFRHQSDPKTGALRFTYHAAELEVKVTVTSRAEGVDFTAEVAPRGNALLEFALPARLRFQPDQLERFVFPTDGNQAVGMALRGSFFQAQAKPTGFVPRVVGDQGYRSLFGGPLVMRPVRDPPVALRVTDEGRQWFGPALSKRLADTQAMVNRPPSAGQAALILVDSEHGPYFAASRLGGKGLLWRVGSGVGASEGDLSTAMVTAVMQRITAERPTGREKVGLIALRAGPTHGGWSGVSVSRWAERLRGQRQVTAGKVHFVTLTTVDELAAAQSGGQFLAILNPYGEWLPVPKAGDMASSVAAIGRYVRGGGNWFEVGGYSFFCELLPGSRFHEYSVNYPPAIADLFHLQTRTGAAAVYRVQPRNWRPWQGAQDASAIFVPGRVACGGDEQGGWCDRPFVTYIAPGQTWQCPAVRLTVGRSAPDDVRAYCQANGITRRLEDKMSPEVLGKFCRSLLVYYSGNCADKLRFLDRLPVPTQIHFADYLQGGFDKQYPDHLPPSARFGTPQQFREFFDAAHRFGHLVVPYTNPTWWCDEPKGPTFLKAGDEPLLKKLDGSLSPERYAKNSGFTVCHWHPAVQEANRRTVKQFREEYPVDVLFQDQCGARGWRYDMNQASPTPYAYTEGLLSMIDEDSRQAPLSTESGWDRVVNAESQLCGMTWALVPSEHAPVWRRLMRDRFDPATWEVFPLAQYVAHDKTAMIHHDLGQFVTNRQILAWTLGLGYSLSYRAHASDLQNDSTRHWLLWLDRLQKSVCARYVGQALGDFQHQRDPQTPAEDDGLIQASYGTLRLTANLGPRPRKEEGRELAGYGFCITAPGLVAANLKTPGSEDSGDEGTSFVARGDACRTDVWIYARPEQETAILLPVATSGPVKLAFDQGPQVQTLIQAGAHRVRLPSRSQRDGQSPAQDHGVKYLWHAVVAEN